MIKIHNVEQQTPEWFALRVQYPLTASEAQAIGNQGKGLETLCWKKVAEKYSSGEQKHFGNLHTDRGNTLEEQARELYSLTTNQEVAQVGFVTDDEISKVGGASPDGDVVGTKGLCEIKCFEDLKHFKLVVQFKETGTFDIESGYEWQMQQQMLFTGKEWVDYLPYNPNYEDSLLIQRVFRDEEKIEQIKEGLKKGEELLNNIESKLK